MMRRLPRIIFLYVFCSKSPKKIDFHSLTLHLFETSSHLRSSPTRSKNTTFSENHRRTMMMMRERERTNTHTHQKTHKHKQTQGERERETHATCNEPVATHHRTPNHMHTHLHHALDRRPWDQQLLPTGRHRVSIEGLHSQCVWWWWVGSS